MKILLAAALLLASTGSVAAQQPAPASPQCMPWETLLREHIAKYQEQPVWRGLGAASGAEYFLFVSPQTGTCTIVQRDAQGAACVLGAGGPPEASAPPQAVPEPPPPSTPPAAPPRSSGTPGVRWV